MQLRQTVDYATSFGNVMTHQASQNYELPTRDPLENTQRVAATIPEQSI